MRRITIRRSDGLGELTFKGESETKLRRPYALALRQWKDADLLGFRRADGAEVDVSRTLGSLFSTDRPDEVPVVTAMMEKSPQADDQPQPGATMPPPASAAAQPARSRDPRVKRRRRHADGR